MYQESQLQRAEAPVGGAENQAKLCKTTMAVSLALTVPFILHENYT